MISYMYLLRAHIFHTAHLNNFTATNQTTDTHKIYSSAYCESSQIGRGEDTDGRQKIKIIVFISNFSCHKARCIRYPLGSSLIG